MNVHPLRCGLGVAFLIETKRGLFLVDSGSPGHQDKVLAKMRELRRTDLKLIWITHAHYDHYGSAAALRSLTGALIGIHPADAGSMSRGMSLLGSWRRYGFIYAPAQKILQLLRPLPAAKPDFTMNDGDSLEWSGLDATVMHTPGHTPGHSCLLLHDGTVFAGDLLARNPAPGVQSLLATDWSRLAGSLAYLLAAQPQCIYTGHSVKPFSGEMLLPMAFK